MYCISIFYVGTFDPVGDECVVPGGQTTATRIDKFKPYMI
nr:fumarate hydratase C-terminal domain-containing protein [Francisella tularensis]